MQHLQNLIEENSARDWWTVWLEFCLDPWVQKQLEVSSRSVLRRLSLPAGWRDDVKHEAILVLARQLKKNSTLGFRLSRGNFPAFVSTVIFRCCQKSARQFQNGHNYSLTDDSHPWFDPRQGLDDQLDLEECIDRLQEPARATVHALTEGASVGEIAAAENRSMRTIYRRIEGAKTQIRQRLDSRH